MSVVLDFLKRFEVHSILIIFTLGVIRQYAAPPLGPTMPTLTSLDFEVHGKVQGVFFRKYTESKAKELELTGWCMNTKEGTVLGYMEGDKNKVEQMKDWLRHTGSPQSRIEKADFRNEKELDTPTLQTFSVKR